MVFPSFLPNSSLISSLLSLLLFVGLKLLRSISFIKKVGSVRGSAQKFSSSIFRSFLKSNSITLNKIN